LKTSKICKAEKGEKKAFLLSPPSNEKGNRMIVETSRFFPYFLWDLSRHFCKPGSQKRKRINVKMTFDLSTANQIKKYSFGHLMLARQG